MNDRTIGELTQAAATIYAAGKDPKVENAVGLALKIRQKIVDLTAEEQSEAPSEES